MNRRLSCQVDLRINTDWTKAIRLFERGLDILETRPELITKEYQINDNAGYHYEISNNMSISHVTNGTPNWYGTNGPLILSALPWLDHMLNDMAPIKPLYPSLNRLIGDGKEHRDQPGMICSINYFIADGSAITTVKDDDYVETYPTKKDTCWLLDIQKLHKITSPSNETRIWLNIRFGASFEQCREWFYNHPNLIYGS